MLSGSTVAPSRSVQHFEQGYAGQSTNCYQPQTRYSLDPEYFRNKSSNSSGFFDQCSEPRSFGMTSSYGGDFRGYTNEEELAGYSNGQGHDTNTSAHNSRIESHMLRRVKSYSENHVTDDPTMPHMVRSGSERATSGRNSGSLPGTTSLPGRVGCSRTATGNGDHAVSKPESFVFVMDSTGGINSRSTNRIPRNGSFPQVQQSSGLPTARSRLFRNIGLDDRFPRNSPPQSVPGQRSKLPLPPSPTNGIPNQRSKIPLPQSPTNGIPDQRSKLHIPQSPNTCIPIQQRSLDQRSTFVRGDKYMSTSGADFANFLPRRLFSNSEKRNSLPVKKTNCVKTTSMLTNLYMELLDSPILTSSTEFPQTPRVRYDNLTVKRVPHDNRQRHDVYKLHDKDKRHEILTHHDSQDHRVNTGCRDKQYNIDEMVQAFEQDRPSIEHCTSEEQFVHLQQPEPNESTRIWSDRDICPPELDAPPHIWSDRDIRPPESDEPSRIWSDRDIRPSSAMKPAVVANVGTGENFQKISNFRNLYSADILLENLKSVPSTGGAPSFLPCHSVPGITAHGYDGSTTADPKDSSALIDKRHSQSSCSIPGRTATISGQKVGKSVDNNDVLQQKPIVALQSTVFGSNPEIKRTTSNLEKDWSRFDSSRLGGNFFTAAEQWNKGLAEEHREYLQTENRLLQMIQCLQNQRSMLQSRTEILAAENGSLHQRCNQLENRMKHYEAKIQQLQSELKVVHESSLHSKAVSFPIYKNGRNDIGSSFRYYSSGSDTPGYLNNNDKDVVHHCCCNDKHLQSELAQCRADFEVERRIWLDEKIKVIRYQKLLQARCEEVFCENSRLRLELNSSFRSHGQSDV